MATQTVPAEVVDLTKHPTIDVLVDVLEQYLAPVDRDLVLAAYEYAKEKHEGHLRRSGHPYIEHPLAAAVTCAELQLDVPALQAALLHDVMEDCGVTRSQLVNEFGVDVAKLVDGASKLSELQRPRVTGTTPNAQTLSHPSIIVLYALTPVIRSLCSGAMSMLSA